MWYITFTAAGNPAITDLMFGLAGDKAYTADMNGDGKQELVVAQLIEGEYQWYWYDLSTGVTYGPVGWGLDGMMLLPPTDLNRDGTDDLIAVEAAGGLMWHVLYNGVPGDENHVPFGLEGDVPFVGYFSGGAAEVAVLRKNDPQIAEFFYLHSETMQTIQQNLDSGRIDYFITPKGQIHAVGR